ncbi:MAG: DUF898 family protein [Deltaproteobacteria bacterium]|nr:DUF898 family protein [Deltaproteobacteria bacterium]
MEKTFEFRGTGGGLFVKYLVGILLTMITFGIYAPWFVVSLLKYVLEHTRMRGTDKGMLKLDFKGTGGRLFVINLVGGLLTLVTFGIYGAWFVAKLLHYIAENTEARAEDGTTYALRFNGTGGTIFVTYLVGMLLTMITFGIYGAWFCCKLTKVIFSNTEILQGGQPHATIDFVATGGSLFVTFLVGYLLTLVTLGIYACWFQVKLYKFFSEGTRVTSGGETLAGDFTGTGGQFFVLNLVGILLTIITLGIYGAWYMTKVLRFRTENTRFAPAR